MSNATPNSHPHAVASLPVIMIITPNTLVNLGLGSIIGRMIPVAKIETRLSLDQVDGQREIFHYFVHEQEYLRHRPFFDSLRKKPILLTESQRSDSSRAAIDISGSEAQITAQIESLFASAHGATHPAQAQSHGSTHSILTKREEEVLVLLSKGLPNKLIADQMNISISTVISHRKNICEKLSIKSVAGLTVYAVVNGYLDPQNI